MDLQKKKTVSIIAFVVGIVAELFACLLWLIPISGFIIYPFVSGFALLMMIISWFCAKENRILRIVDCIIGIILIGTIFADVIFLIRFVLGIL